MDAICNRESPARMPIRQINHHQHCAQPYQGTLGTIVDPGLKQLFECR